MLNYVEKHQMGKGARYLCHGGEVDLSPLAHIQGDLRRGLTCEIKTGVMSGAAMLLSDPGSLTYNNATKGDMACFALALSPMKRAHATANYPNA